MGFSKLFPFTIISFFVFAVTNSSSAISFGIGAKGGINLGNAEIEGHDDTDYQTGLAMGLLGEFGITNPYSLVIEPSYVQKGAKFTYDAGILGEVKANGELDYIEIPVLLKAKFGSMKTHAFIFAGPSLGINVAAKGKIGVFSDTFEDNIAPTVWSGDAGAGVAFQLQQFVYLSAEARYSHGFTDALDASVGDIESWYSRDIRMMLGITVALFD
jgi:Outer membrane protein beta-barrel domain